MEQKRQQKLANDPGNHNQKGNKGQNGVDDGPATMLQGSKNKSKSNNDSPTTPTTDKEDPRN